ncbi:hypothetical protein IM697_24915 [Streptomyces ferrugineus]|uniref:MFS transporter n=1 Tax=Streptomyces ferrugineus TaxID=1413221 RepID=A0A7M2SB09_9ACTN|nr:hypothetical protein [Streptomyces ferrugineus]QOV33452.1 hypothetical protein IM697_24915 [Streptomyces ferrugineus]
MISVGSGLLLAPITTAVASGVDPSGAGAASGLMNTTKRVDGVLGLVALSALAADASGVPAGFARVFGAIAVVLAVVAVVSLTYHQEQIVEQLEVKLGRDSREDVRLRLLGEIAFGAYRVGAKNWTAGRGKGAGSRGKGGRATLAARVDEAFDAVPDAIALDAD